MIPKSAHVILLLGIGKEISLFLNDPLPLSRLYSSCLVRRVHVFVFFGLYSSNRTSLISRCLYPYITIHVTVTILAYLAIVRHSAVLLIAYAFLFENVRKAENLGYVCFCFLSLKKCVGSVLKCLEWGVE